NGWQVPCTSRRCLEQRSYPSQYDLPARLCTGISLRRQWRLPLRPLTLRVFAMRAGSWIAIVVIAYAPLFASSHASADPKPASAYSVELIRKPAAIFAGLARDGDELLVTDLGNGRLF